MRALATWWTLTVGILAVAIGLATLARKEVVLRRQRRRNLRWRLYGWGNVCFGAMFLLGRLESSAYDISGALGLAVVVGVVATGAAGAVLVTRAQRPLVTPGSSHAPRAAGSVDDIWQVTKQD